MDTPTSAAIAVDAKASKLAAKIRFFMKDVFYEVNKMPCACTGYKAESRLTACIVLFDPAGVCAVARISCAMLFLVCFYMAMIQDGCAAWCYPVGDRYAGLPGRWAMSDVRIARTRKPDG